MATPGKALTLQEIRESDKPFLLAEEVAKILCASPQGIRAQAREQVKTGIPYLGFPVIVLGCRVRIPRVGFLAYIDGKGAPVRQEEKV